MLVYSISLLVFNTGLTILKSKTLLFSRTAFIVFITLSYMLYNNIMISFLEKGISLYNGLLYTKSQTIVFTFVIYILTAIILIITSFYPRKI